MTEKANALLLKAQLKSNIMAQQIKESADCLAEKQERQPSLCRANVHSYLAAWQGQRHCSM